MPLRRGYRDRCSVAEPNMRFTLTNLRFGNVNRYAAKPCTCRKKNEAFSLDKGFPVWHIYRNDGL